VKVPTIADRAFAALVFGRALRNRHLEFMFALLAFILPFITLEDILP
jgi:hypothetical protein